MSAPRTPANTGVRRSSGTRGFAARTAADGAPGIQAGVRVPPQQLAADQQGDLAVGIAADRARRGRWPRPGVDRVDVVAAAAVPEPAERRAALVGGERAPEQLAVELVVDTDEQRLHEPGVRLEHRDRVDGDLADAREEAGGVDPREVRVQRHVQGRRHHDAVEVGRQGDAVRRVDQRTGRRLGQLARDADGDHGREPARHRLRGVGRRHQRLADRPHAQRLEVRRRAADDDLGRRPHGPRRPPAAAPSAGR